MTATMTQPGQTTSPAPAPWRELVWMGFALAVPHAWEVLGHSTKLRRGRLLLVDRRRQRMQLSWASCESRPDLRRAFEDYRSADREDDPSCAFAATAAASPWQGYVRRDADGSAITRLGRYIHKRRLWLEMVLSWPGGHEADVEAEITARFALAAPPCPPALGDDEPAPGPVRWRAFGLDVTVPPGWWLRKADVRPADVTFHFSDARDAAGEVRTRRLGLLEAWYDDNPHAFLQKEVGYAVDCDVRPVQHAGVNAWLCVSDEPMPRYRRLAGRGRTRRDLLWPSEAAGGMLCVTTFSPEKAPVEPTAFNVTGAHQP